MSTHIVRAVATAATAAMVFSLAACGGDAEPQEASPTSATPAPASPTETASESPAGSPSESDSPEGAEAIMITIEDFEFSVPGPVAPGGEITVENLDSATHTVTADGKGGFDVDVPAETTATFTAPDEPGEYAFHCAPHPAMISTLVVG